jgi:tripartite-type tricarboxylate transporter receptor subunit TctC
MRTARVLIALVTLLLAFPAKADPVGDFYRNRTVAVVIGYSVGGGYDTYARVLARHMGRHIPGNPTLVPQNMPGAGSLKAANYLAGVAPKDGSTFGIVGRGLAMEPLLGGANFDAVKLTWVGSITNETSVCGAWHLSPIKRWDDIFATEFKVGGNGSGSDPDIFALVMRNIFGAKIKLITGYPGSSDINLAIERGEIEGRCGWSLSSLKSRNPTWLADKKFNLLVQFALAKSPELPDVPLIMDLTTSPEQRQILRLILARQVMGRPFLAPPGVPAERKEALRRAFDATMRDPEFLADAEKTDLEVNPVAGEAIDALLAELYQTPKAVADKAARAIQK